MTSDTQAINAGRRAENIVLTVLEKLPEPWQVFHTLEWRTVHENLGEKIGEADVVIFHPFYGLLIMEIKAGAVNIREGVWYYESGNLMKQSPFAQARRNRYALTEKLQNRLSKGEVNPLAITHAVWFPEINWIGPLPSADAPSHAFLFDRSSLANPEAALIKLWEDAAPNAVKWSPHQQRILKEILAPDCHGGFNSEVQS